MVHLLCLERQSPFFLPPETFSETSSDTYFLSFQWSHHASHAMLFPPICVFLKARPHDVAQRLVGHISCEKARHGALSFFFLINKLVPGAYSKEKLAAKLYTSAPSCPILLEGLARTPRKCIRLAPSTSRRCVNYHSESRISGGSSVIEML